MPYRLKDIKAIERVQMRATKHIKSISKLPYIERLKRLKLPTLHYRRVRGDIILVYKMVHNIYPTSAACNFTYSNTSWTRGNTRNSFKLFPSMHNHKFSRNFFVNRIVRIWNSLPDNIVNAPSVLSFEHQLDKFWSSQELLYNWHSVITGTGNRSSYEVIQTLY